MSSRKEEIIAYLEDKPGFAVKPIFTKPIEDLSEDEYELKRIQCLELLANLVKPHRMAHSVSVAELCAKVARQNAEKYGLSVYEAYFAGLLHDCGKGLGQKKSHRLMKRYYPNYVNHPTWTYHQFMGRLLTARIFGVRDESILDAVEYHATGKKKMGPYQKLVYACDKIDPFRGYDSRYMIDAMMEDLDEGFRFVLSENLRYYGDEGFSVDDPFAVECFDYYLKK